MVKMSLVYTEHYISFSGTQHHHWPAATDAVY